MDNSKKAVNAQNIYLNKLRHDKVDVNIFLISGTRLFGVIKGFDQFTVILENAGSQTMVFKSSIASISPQNKFMAIKGVVNE